MTEKTNSAMPTALCITCGTLGPAKSEMIGVRFDCPNADRFRPHVSYVVADEGITPWMRFEALLLAYQSRFSPLRVIPLFRARGRKGRVGAYVLVRFGLLAAAVGVSSVLRHSIAGRALLWVVSGVAAVDIIAAHTSGVFTSRWPAHPLRAVWLSFFAALQLALCFAVIYALRPADFCREITPWDAVYFSVVTFATVGYGDIVPRPGASLVQGLVVSEILAGLYFLSVLLAQIVAWVGERPPRPKTLQEVIDRGPRSEGAVNQ